MSQGNSVMETEMSGIKVKSASKVYQFPKFDIPCGIPLFADYIPERLTQLSIKGKKLIIEFGEPAYNKFVALIAENSRLLIKDEYGIIYADFDRYSYRIYELPPDISIEQLQMAIAAFSVVQHICLELRGTVLAP
jgi:hypothetical protein